MFRNKKTGAAFHSWEATKEAMILTLQPITKQLSRSLGNGLPVTAAMLYEMQAQIDAIEVFLHNLQPVAYEELPPPGRKAIARPVHQPGDATYQLEPPRK